MRSTILTVCTGNICRSPAMEMMLREGVGGRVGLPDEVVVSSVGVRAVTGSAIDPRTAAAMTRMGLTTSGFTARQAHPEMIASADLVLTATRRQRSKVVRMHPPALHRTFTIAELARYARAMTVQQSLSSSDLDDPLRDLITFAQDRRGSILPRRAADDDVADPQGRSRFVHRATVNQLAELVGDVLQVATCRDRASH